MNKKIKSEMKVFDVFYEVLEDKKYIHVYSRNYFDEHKIIPTKKEALEYIEEINNSTKPAMKEISLRVYDELEPLIMAIKSREGVNSKVAMVEKMLIYLYENRVNKCEKIDWKNIDLEKENNNE